MIVNATSQQAFYDAQYLEGRYAAYASPMEHPFHDELKNLLSRYGCANGSWLEVGCGRGLLQDVVTDYVGVDIADTVSVYLRKPFRCAPAETLPFADGAFDGAWSYAVLEHVDDPGQALAEIRRVVKSGGMLFLSPAWQCRSWAGKDYAWKSYSDLPWLDRICKALIPIRNSVAFRSLFIFPVRLFRLLSYVFRRSPTQFRSRRLEPNYTEYRVIDADARHAMDPFEAILWFRSRGDQVCSHPGWLESFFVRTGVIVVEVCKP